MPTTHHRLLLPALLSPLAYPSSTSQPTILLSFFHVLRALLREYPTRLSAFASLPLNLHPRATGLTRWIEELADGVVELAPLEGLGGFDGSGNVGGNDEQPHGLLRIHKVPVAGERGGGVGEAGGEEGGEWAFTLSRRRMTIRPFWMPPVEGEGEKEKKVELEF
jgi:elongator complex protein 4